MLNIYIAKLSQPLINPFLFSR